MIVKINMHAKYCNTALSTHIFHIPLKKSYFQNAFACHHKDVYIYKKKVVGSFPAETMALLC